MDRGLSGARSVGTSVRWAGGCGAGQAGEDAGAPWCRGSMVRRSIRQGAEFWSAGVLTGQRRRRGWTVGFPARGRSGRRCVGQEAAEWGRPARTPALHGAALDGLAVDTSRGGVLERRCPHRPAAQAGMDGRSSGARSVVTSARWAGGCGAAQAGEDAGAPWCRGSMVRRSIRLGAEFWSEGVLTGQRHRRGRTVGFPAPGRSARRRVGQEAAERRRPARTPALHGAGARWFGGRYVEGRSSGAPVSPPASGTGGDGRWAFRRAVGRDVGALGRRLRSGAGRRGRRRSMVRRSMVWRSIRRGAEFWSAGVLTGQRRRRGWTVGFPARGRSGRWRGGQEAAERGRPARTPALHGTDAPYVRALRSPPGTPELSPRTETTAFGAGRSR